ncbi:MAG: hypothetical protein ONB46_15615 [candidate division KSB1 bacterium]|nr:hypothetical protein [candidate division KSB1 bacterium]MDZ7367144.1 hypothetical protein [candidate division KSB1 bacterium]MDZ7405122.1 hypothetical protein [candidate division KSB1 bacterium]
MGTQILINGLIAGSVYALVALGFSIIYSTVRFFHFAHGAVYTAGAYFTYLFFALCNLPFALAVALAVLFAALLGVAIEFFIYKPIKGQDASGKRQMAQSCSLLSSGFSSENHLDFLESMS